MSHVVETFGDRDAVITDLGPVEELMGIAEGKFDPKEMDLIRGMGKRQLQYAITELLGRYRSSGGMIRHLHTSKGQEAVSTLRHLKKACDEQGIELWEDWPELTE